MVFEIQDQRSKLNPPSTPTKTTTPGTALIPVKEPAPFLLPPVAPLPPKVPSELPELLAAEPVAEEVAEVVVVLYCFGLCAPQRFCVRQLSAQALLLRPHALTHWLPYSWHS